MLLIGGRYRPGVGWRTVLVLALAGVMVCGGCSRGSSNHSSAARETTTVPTTTNAPRRIVLDDGKSVTVDNDDHVVVVGADGRPDSESWCGSYTRKVGFITGLQVALRHGDRRKVAGLVLYPLHWNRIRGGVSIDDQAALLDRYAEIFPPDVVNHITSIDARGLFCNWHGFMIGHGEVWGNVGENGRYGLTTLNA